MSTPRKPGARRAPSSRPTPPSVEARLFVANAPDIPVQLALCARGGKPFFVTAGQTVSLPAGKYAAAGNWFPNWDGRIFGGYVYPSPPLSVDCLVTIPEEGGDVPVEARFFCFALSLGKGCDHYRVRGYDGAMMRLPWMRDGRCFIQGAWSYPPLTIVAVPEPYQGLMEKSYEIVTDTAQMSDDVSLVQYGKTYAFDTAEYKEREKK